MTQEEIRIKNNGILKHLIHYKEFKDDKSFKHIDKYVKWVFGTVLVNHRFKFNEDAYQETIIRVYRFFDNFELTFPKFYNLIYTTSLRSLQHAYNKCAFSKASKLGIKLLYIDQFTQEDSKEFYSLSDDEVYPDQLTDLHVLEVLTRVHVLEAFQDFIKEPFTREQLKYPFKEGKRYDKIYEFFKYIYEDYFNPKEYKEIKDEMKKYCVYNFDIKLANALFLEYLIERYPLFGIEEYLQSRNMSKNILDSTVDKMREEKKLRYKERYARKIANKVVKPKLIDKPSRKNDNIKRNQKAASEKFKQIHGKSRYMVKKEKRDELQRLKQGIT